MRNAKKDRCEILLIDKIGSIVLTFRFCPAGKPAINTPGTLAMRTLPPGYSDQDGPGFIADCAAESLTGSTQGRFIGFFTVTHTTTSKKGYKSQKMLLNSFFILIEVPGKCIEQFSC
jgi:hypothetical protein